jgi:ABC-type transport system substrate-binding protein
MEVMMIRKLLLTTLFLLMTASIYAQDGRGVVVIGLPGGPESLADMQPTLCNETLCRELSDLLLPSFRAVDPHNGAFIPADADNFGLVESFEFAADNTIIFTIRDDLTWRDGTAVTAYDIYYSYLNALPDDVAGAVPLDSRHIAFLYNSADCAALDRASFTVVPALDVDFADIAETYFEPDEDLRMQSKKWFEDRVYPRPSVSLLDVVESGRTVGPYFVEEVRPLESLRLHAVGDSQGILYTVLPTGRGEVDALFAGDVTLIANADYDRRAEILNKDDLHIASMPSQTAYYLRFNMADPTDPQPAYDEESEPLEQGRHPVLGDPAVRQAIRYAIDVQTLIDYTTNGFGTPLAGAQPPQSWAANPDLTPATYDPGRAMRLLEDAGWRDTNFDGVRECIRCAYGQQNQPLYFTLMAPDSEPASTIANMIAQRQLRRVGISVDVGTYNTDNQLRRTTTRKRFDAYLAEDVLRYPYAPDRGGLFARDEDALETGSNDISYDNPRVDDLYRQAQAVPDCDIHARAPLYQEIEAILADDLPEIWLFSPDIMVAADDSVLNFEPLAYAPFWNINQWTVIGQEAQR